MLIGVVTKEPAVLKRGFEPPHPFGYWFLRPARLPFRHLSIVRDTGIEPVWFSLSSWCSPRELISRQSTIKDSNLSPVAYQASEGNPPVIVG